MKRELVSIIIPVSNAHGQLDICVEKLLEQSYQHYEIVIISRDGTNYVKYLDNLGIKDVRLKQYNPLKRYVNANVAKNHGIEKASGDWVTFCDIEDEFSPFRLEHLIDQARGHKIVMDQTRFWLNGQVLGTSPQLTKDEGILGPEDFCCTNTPISPLFHRSIIENIRFEEKLPYGEDLLFILRAIFANNNQYKQINNGYYEHMVNARRLPLHSKEMFVEAINYICQELRNLGHPACADLVGGKRVLCEEYIDSKRTLGSELFLTFLFKHQLAQFGAINPNTNESEYIKWQKSESSYAANRAAS